MKHPDSRIQALLDRLVPPSLAPIDLSLSRIASLLAKLGNPHEKLPPVVHVAGTNGKGSLVAYLTAIMRAAGYRVHRYTSPHLVRFNERIMLAGEEIDDARLLAALEHVMERMGNEFATFFEATTAAAFMAFAETPADVVLLETGLGGRLDATNVVRAPLLTAITPISIDHIEFLGNTIEAIAAEKAGILKQGRPCVLGPQIPEVLQVLEKAAGEKNAPLYQFGQEWTVKPAPVGLHYRSPLRDERFPAPALAGEHQLANAATAIACIERMEGFRVSRDHIVEGLARVVWPARLQRLTSGALAALLPVHGELWLDGGHNPGAGETLARWAAARKKPLHLICGMLNNKDTAGFLTPLAPHVQSLMAIAIDDEPSSQQPQLIVQTAKACGIKNTTVMQNAKNAVEAIVKENRNNPSILICGSLYLAGNILWQNNPDK